MEAGGFVNGKVVVGGGDDAGVPRQKGDKVARQGRGGVVDGQGSQMGEGALADIVRRLAAIKIVVRHQRDARAEPGIIMQIHGISDAAARDPVHVADSGPDIARPLYTSDDADALPCVYVRGPRVI